MDIMNPRDMENSVLSAAIGKNDYEEKQSDNNYETDVDDAIDVISDP